MKKIAFITAKNNSLSCTTGDKPLHSLYNPENEAKRFAENIQIPFKPEFICIVEPCISYCLPFFKERFPDTKFLCIRISEEFSSYDSGFCKSFLFKNKIQLENDLFNYLGDQGLCKTFFLNWEPAAKLMPEENLQVWEAIKNAVKKSASSVYTHNSFSRRWIKNAVKTCSFSNKTAEIQKTNFPVVITASGPGLKKAIPILKQLREKYILFAVSSSLNALLKNNIIPDMVISTDGGWWAKKHLEPLKNFKSIPLAISSEGNCNGEILRNTPLVPLLYSDGIESRLLKQTFSNGIIAQRNGTVSGTAAELALSFTTENVYAFGLDLCPGKGLQHTAPNLLEPYNSLKDCRLKPLETRVSASRFNAGALKIYNQWFASQTDSKWNRFFRVKDKNQILEPLGIIKDINLNDFMTIFEKEPCANFKFSVKNREIKRSVISDFLKNNWDSDEWLKNAFPFDYLNLEKSISSQEKLSIQEKLKVKNLKFQQELEKLIK